MKSKIVKLFCTACGSEFSGLVTHCDCGGLVETAYDGADAGSNGGGRFFERFWPVLPIADPAAVAAETTLATPTVRAHALRAAIGGPELWLKDESVLPTSTTKDRVAIVVFPFLRQFGVREFVVSSTGNTSSAIARMARSYPDMRVHIFVGRDFAGRLRGIASANVMTHLVDGNFVAAGKAGQDFAERRHLFWEAGFFNPSRRDGLKTAFIEAVLDMGGVPSCYVQAISSAMGVVGTAKAAQELPAFGYPAATPKLVCVQQATCSPMVNAWEDGSPKILPEHVVREPTGIAKAILRGDPSRSYPIVQSFVRRSDGTFVRVSVPEIRHAQALLKHTTGILACEAGACALAGYAKLVDQGWFRDEPGPVLVNITGGPERRDVAH